MAPTLISITITQPAPIALIWIRRHWLITHKPNQSLVLSDTLNVGDSSSELSHSYTINSQTWNGSLTGTYEGNDDDKLIIDNGRAHSGYSQFNMAIPSSNQGIVLRRTFNHSIDGKTTTSSFLLHLPVERLKSPSKLSMPHRLLNGENTNTRLIPLIIPQVQHRLQQHFNRAVTILAAACWGHNGGG
jgi:hypothetical protein